MYTVNNQINIRIIMYLIIEGVEISPLLYLPFVFSAYFVTVGLIYSNDMTIFGVFLGPIFLPMLFVIPGVLTGLIVIKIITWFIKER